MARFLLIVCFALMALLAIGVAGQDRRPLLNRWFEAESDLANQNVREKRAYTGNYYQGGWKKGSNVFEPAGVQKRLRCKSLTKTSTNEWCSENCVRGYCPVETCICSGIETYRPYNAYQHISVQQPQYQQQEAKQNLGYEYQ